MSQSNVAAVNGMKTCKITLANQGNSDKVLKVYPAEHEAEKIWLDNANGIARWEAVKRLLNQYAPRGEAVPNPVAYHEGTDLKTVVISEADIPVIRLEGAVFKKPVEDAPIGEKQVKLNPSVENLQLRMERMENNIGQLVAAIQVLTQPKATIQTEAQGTVPPASVNESVRVPCGLCGKTFKNNAGAAMHAGKFHKNAK